MIYIQSIRGTAMPSKFDSACVMYAAIDEGKQYAFVEFTQVENGSLDAMVSRNLFVGSVEFMRGVFKRMGKNDVRLPCNSNRQHAIMTLGEAKAIAANGTEQFIKPVAIKLFTGMLLGGFQYTCLEGLPDSTPVMAYEPFPHHITTEWRCYVHNHEIVYAGNYSGDFETAPDYGYVRSVIQANISSFPVAYTIDVAVLANGETVVVEFNDMWATGSYGIPNDMYLRMLKDRYFQIVRS